MVALPLRFVPDLASLHVYLNGIEQYSSVDWYYHSASNQIVVLSGMDAQSADLLECRYSHHGKTPSLNPDPTAPPAELQSWSYRFYQTGPTASACDITMTWMSQYTRTVKLRGSFTWTSDVGGNIGQHFTTPGDILTVVFDAFVPQVVTATFQATTSTRVDNQHPVITQPNIFGPGGNNDGTLGTWLISSVATSTPTATSAKGNGVDNPVRYTADVPKQAAYWPGRGGLFVGANLT